MMTVKNALGDLALEETQLSQNELIELLTMLAQHVGVLSAVRETTGALRVSVVNAPSVAVSSGTITNIVGQSSTGGVPTNQVVPAAQNLAALIGNIDHITFS